MKPASGRKAFVRIACGSALSLLAPVLLALVWLLSTQGRLYDAERARLLQTLESRAEQTSLLMDEAVERAQTAAYSLWRSDAVSPFLRGGKGEMYRVIAGLNDLALVNSRLIEDIALCFFGQDVAATAAGRSEIGEIYARFVQSDMTREEWESASRGFTAGRLLLGGDGGIVFMQTYPVTPIGDKSRAALLVKLRRTLPGDIAVLDERTGECLYGHLIDGALTARRVSGRLPLVYLAQSDRAPLDRYAADLSRRAAIIGGACLAAVAALTIIMTRRRLDPLRRLAALARGESAALPLDPYDEIRAALLDAAQQRLLLNAVRGEEKEKERLKALIPASAGGAADGVPLKTRMEAAGLPTSGKPILLIRLWCYDADAYLLGEGDERDALSLAGEIMRRLLRGAWQIKSVKTDDNVWLFVLPDEKQLSGCAGRISDVTDCVRRLLRDAYGVDAQAEQSPPLVGAEELARAFADLSAGDQRRAVPAETDNALFRRAADAVAAHYADPNMSVAMLARVLGYSPEYLSRAFKKAAGQGLLTYIHAFQVEKAKELLAKTPPVSVRQTAAMVGFSSSESFIRTFKRHEGVTPGVYQERAGADRR